MTGGTSGGFEPGIPGDLFTYIEAVPGLLDELGAKTTPDEVTDLLVTAAAAGEIPQVVAQHIDMWNQLKATSATYVLDYAVFSEEHLPLWADAGLPAPDASGDWGGTFGRPQVPAVSDKVGRNEQCPCGSGRKYKHCCAA